jgi:hypothetical protein
MGLHWRHIFAANLELGVINMAIKPEIRSLVGQIMSFMEFLIENSNYIIFEKPAHKKRVKWESGYRDSSNRVGDNRAHTVNLHFPLVRPSESEVENYVLEWAKDDENSNSLNDLNGMVGSSKDEVLARWSSLIMKFMDKFVQNYLITMRQSGNNNGKVQMGYRQHEAKDETRVSMFVSFQVASKRELTAIADVWVTNYLNRN